MVPFWAAAASWQGTGFSEESRNRISAPGPPGQVSFCSVQPAQLYMMTLDLSLGTCNFSFLWGGEGDILINLWRRGKAWLDGEGPALGPGLAFIVKAGQKEATSNPETSCSTE